jgi:hypothetical protein
MAKIVFAFGSSHGPTIETRPENWDDIVARDMKDPRYRYEDLLRKANPALEKEISLGEKQRRWNAGQTAIANIKNKLADTKADVAVVVSNPHGILPDDTIAVFGVFRGETLTLAAAIDPVPMTLVDYQPCYRSLAGTRHGVTFGVWNT